MYSDICMVIDICIPTQSFSLSSVNAFVYWRMCSLTIECVLLRQNVFVYYRMHSLTIECVLLLQNAFFYNRMCSFTIECILLLQNVFSYYSVFVYYTLLHPTKLSTSQEEARLETPFTGSRTPSAGLCTRYSMSFVFITMPLLYQGLCIRYSMSL